MVDDRFPTHCAALNPGDEKPVLIVRGERGYYPCPGTAEDVDCYNESQGISPAVVEAMLAGSMFGWDCPGASTRRRARACTITPPRKWT